MSWINEGRTVPKYPHLEYLTHVRPDPHIVLGRRIDWTMKEDGSNCGIYLNEKNELTIRSRNMDVCDETMKSVFMRTGLYENVLDCLLSAKQWNLNYIIFGELMTKGKSPTRIKTYDKDEFKVFDIYSEPASSEGGQWMGYVKMAQECNHSNIPFVECLGTSVSKTMEHLQDKITEMLTICKESRNEGVVAKVYELPLFFKAKTDTPPMPKADVEEGKIMLPPLSESDLYGAISKVLESEGKEKFMDKKYIMPLIAKSVSQECESHYRSKPTIPIFEAYMNKCGEL